MADEIALSRIHHELIRGLIESGTCPKNSELGQRFALGTVQIEELLRGLAEIHGLVLHPHVCEPWIVHPFSLTPTIHWIKGQQGNWWAPCVWCALGIAALIRGEAQIHTRIGGEAEPLTLQVIDGRPVGFDDICIHFAIPPARAWQNVHQHCSMVLPFRSRQDIHDWCKATPIPIRRSGSTASSGPPGAALVWHLCRCELASVDGHGSARHFPGGWTRIIVLGSRRREGKVLSTTASRPNRAVHPEAVGDEMFRGTLLSIHIAPAKAEPTQQVAAVRAIVGRGFEGDRYFCAAGTFSKSLGAGREVTLIEIEAIEALQEKGILLAPGEARRNLVTRGVPLNHLVGRSFQVGDVRLRGIRLCEPCAHLESLTRTGVLSGLIHRGGLRAEIVNGGVIRVGDSITD